MDRSKGDQFRSRLQELFEATDHYYEEICNVISKSLVSSHSCTRQYNSEESDRIDGSTRSSSWWLSCLVH